MFGYCFGEKLVERINRTRDNRRTINSKRIEGEASNNNNNTNVSVRSILQISMLLHRLKDKNRKERLKNN